MSDAMEHTKAGQIQIADEVVEIIAATASLEVEGVVPHVGNPTQGVMEFFGKKNQSRGVKISVEDNIVEVDMDITVRFGCKVMSVAEKVQEKVRNAIETMTNYSVAVVNVNVSAITIEKTEAAAE